MFKTEAFWPTKFVWRNYYYYLLYFQFSVKAVIIKF